MRTYISLFLLLLAYPVTSQPLVKNDIHNLPAVGRGDMKWFDVNLDGLYDVVITGIDDNSQRVADVFRNNGDDTFTGYGSGLVPVSDGSIALGDINHDGLIDWMTLSSILKMHGRKERSVVFFSRLEECLERIKEAPHPQKESLRKPRAKEYQHSPQTTIFYVLR